MCWSYGSAAIGKVRQEVLHDQNKSKSRREGTSKNDVVICYMYMLLNVHLNFENVSMATVVS